MYKLFTDKSELFECDIKLEGASLSKSSARLVVETSDYSLLFNQTVSIPCSNPFLSSQQLEKLCTDFGKLFQILSQLF